MNVAKRFWLTFKNLISVEMRGFKSSVKPKKRTTGRYCKAEFVVYNLVLFDTPHSPLPEILPESYQWIVNNNLMSSMRFWIPEIHLNLSFSDEILTLIMAIHFEWTIRHHIVVAISNDSWWMSVLRIWGCLRLFLPMLVLERVATHWLTYSPKTRDWFSNMVSM